MTTIDLAGSVPATSTSARQPFTRAGLVKAGIGLGVAAVLTAIVLGTAQTGPEGNPRLTHPDPSGNVLVDGYPRTGEPLWGVENWPEVFGFLMLGVATIVMAPFVVTSIRERRVSHGLMVFGAVAILSILDPPANWVSYTIYDPRLLHFPTSWSWMSLSPSVEPLLVVPGYPFYYFSIALIAFGFGQRVLLPRLKEGSWFRRHPRTFLFCVGFGMGTLWDIPTELLMIRAEMYFYAQRFGPELSWGGNHAGLPIIWSLLTIISIATITPLLHRNDSGESIMTTLARRLPRISRRTATNQPSGVSAGRQIVAGGLVLWAMYLVLILVWGLFRVTGMADNPTKGDWRYGEIKTYDPYSTLEDAGFPGPYYK